MADDLTAQERIRRSLARAAQRSGLDTRDRSDPEALRAGTVGTSGNDDSQPPPDRPSPGGGSVVLRRRYRRHKDRETVWTATPATAADLLAGLADDVQRVYLVGPRPVSPRGWAAVGLPEGWDHAPAGHYLHGQNPVWRFTRGGRTVEVHRAAGYLGDGAYTVGQAREAMGLVDDQLREWGTKLLASASTTGRAVLERTIPPGDWPCLDDEHQDLIRSTSGQGRWQPSATGGTLVEPGTPLRGLHEYDGRFMYAALCWGLGAGPATLDDGDQWEGQRRGRYLVEWEAPEGWPGPGILPEPIPGGGPRAWSYPLRGRGWCDGSEVHLALSQRWRVTIRRRLLLADNKPTRDPLRAWADRMVAAREAVTHEDPEVVRLARNAWRAMTLFTIGTLHGREHTVTRVAPLAESRRAPGTATLDGDHLVWSEPTGRAWPAMSHPEWSSAIWARARVRLLAGPSQVGALHVQPGNRVVGFRTDAVYLERREPRWEANDDGRPGRLVYQGGTDNGVEAPATSAELLTIRGAWRADK